MKRAAFVTSLPGLALSHAALAQSPAAPPKPKLIVAISVDQFSTDLFNEYRPYYVGGLKRLSRGVVFPAGYQSHAATETCPGHSTILTGSRPARTGIIANDWMDPKLPRPGIGGKPSYDVYCAEDPKVAPSGGGYTVSANFLRVPTLGDRMKAADPRTRVVAVSGKDRAAVMMGGHNADLTLWWGGKAFVTYAGRDVMIPTQLAAINAKANASIAKPVKPLLPKVCQGHARDVVLSPTFSLGTLKPRKPGDERSWRGSTDFDSKTLDVALAAKNALKLGKGEGTDILAVSFSATDYVGHGTGTAGAEICTQIVGLDATLGRLFKALDTSKTPYAVVLTADHGGHDMPERNDIQGLPAAERVDITISASVAGPIIAKQLGLTGSALIGRGTFGDFYVSPTVPADKRQAVIAAATDYYRTNRQVAAVFTRDQLIAAPVPKPPVDEWSLLERAKASFDPERSGDIVVLLKPNVTPIPTSGAGYVATHGSPWNYDRRVPILFWWKGISAFEQPNAIETVDILPTLASLIALPVPPADIDGRCVDLVAGTGTNCK